MMRSISRRSAFTLVEMLVVMAIIAFLAALVMLIAPSVLDNDRARDSASQIQGALQNARMRAMRDGMPRGVRFIIDQPATDPPQLIPAAGPSPNIFFTASSYQYIEVPPWLIFTNTLGLNGGTTPTLQINYTLNPKPTVVGTTTYQPGSIGTANSLNRGCIISGLNAVQLTQLQSIVNNAEAYTTPVIVGVPTISYWTQIVAGTYVQLNANSCSVGLAIYPDAALGAANVWSTSAAYTGTTGASGPGYFGIYQSPRPLLGEPVVQLPLNTTVDLSDGVSYPSYAQYVSTLTTQSGLNFATVNGILPGYDVLFSPSGQMMMPTGYGHLYLWVRDPTKGYLPTGIGSPIGNTTNGNPYCSMSPSAPWMGGLAFGQYPTAYATANTAGAPYNLALTRGGEQLIVSLKGNSGSTGVVPVFWGSPPYANAMLNANTP